MTSESKRKTLVDVELSIWAKVKHFATINNLSLNDAVQLLLKMGLDKCGYTVQEHVMLHSGKSLTASNQKISLAEIH
jgi:macrodomain Ter protein organizer (MatP/YcbG family)